MLLLKARHPTSITPWITSHCESPTSDLRAKEPSFLGTYLLHVMTMTSTIQQGELKQSWLYGVANSRDQQDI